MITKNIKHCVSWTVDTVVVNDDDSFLGKLMKKLGHTKIQTDTYVMDVSVAVRQGDSIDSTLRSMLTQLKNISMQDEHKINAHNGIRKNQFIRSDMVK